MIENGARQLAAPAVDGKMKACKPLAFSFAPRPPLAMTDTCPICCEPANATGRKPVACQFCLQAACATCVRQYLLSRPDEPQCMSCHAIWDDEALERGLPKSFIDGAYKDHRKQVMFDREKARLPEAMERAKAERTMREALANKEVVQKEIDALMLQVNRMRERMEGTIAAAEWNQRRAARGDVSSGSNQHKARFIHHCPAPNCRGFLETERHTCGVCAIRCCNKCIKPLGDDGDDGDAHVCNTEDIETIKLLKSTSRSCPNCAVPIFKIDGCDQMYCTACHTAFSWTTGNVEKGRVHNPHYYEFMRRNGAQQPRELGDVVCGGFPQDHAFIRWLSPFETRADAASYEARHKLLMCMRVFVHAEDVMLHAYRAQPADVDANMDLRVKYLLGDYSEADVKRELAKRAKAANKKQAVRLVLEMLVAAAGDVARGHLATPLATAQAAQAMLSEFDVLRLFANKALARISKTYGAVVPVFVESWQSPEMHKA